MTKDIQEAKTVISALYKVKNTIILHNKKQHIPGATIKLTKDEAEKLADYVSLIPGTEATTTVSTAEATVTADASHAETTDDTSGTTTAATKKTTAKTTKKTAKTADTTATTDAAVPADKTTTTTETTTSPDGVASDATAQEGTNGTTSV